MPRRNEVVRGLLDTSVVIDLEQLDAAKLPEQMAISSITLAELFTGPHAALDPAERATRQDRLQRAETVFEPLAFGAKETQAYGRVFALVAARGRKPQDVWQIFSLPQLRLRTDLRFIPAIQKTSLSVAHPVSAPPRVRLHFTT